MPATQTKVRKVAKATKATKGTKGTKKVTGFALWRKAVELGAKAGVLPFEADLANPLNHKEHIKRGTKGHAAITRVFEALKANNGNLTLDQVRSLF